MLTDLTSQRTVYSIFTRSLEYSNAIHRTPFWSWCTISGVVAGIGPGAALELGPEPADLVGGLAIGEPDGACGVRLGGMTDGGRWIDG